jgi:replication initiation protein RepC
MHSSTVTTPFGRRPLSLAMVTSQKRAKTVAPDATVHKWQVFRDICEAKAALSVGDRAIAVLNALLSFHPETALSGAGDLIVFPSNTQLALRAHGMAPATLRRHLAGLVEGGLIIRRDSPNGKRFARKGEGGGIEAAFGFDLTPLVVRAGEIAHLAEAAREERRKVLILRQRITLARRDIAKMIALGMDEGLAGDWQGLAATYAGLAARIPRHGGAGELIPVAGDLEIFAQEIANRLESQLDSDNSSANESRIERHIQNSNPDSLTESEPLLSKSKGNALPAQHRVANSPTGRSFPLPMVLEACPDIADYVRGGVGNWRDFVAAAGLVRSVLGISPSAYDDAVAILGPEDAAVIVAAILQRGEAIRSPGGYLRNLVDKAKAGQFSLGPVLMALIRARGREKLRA